MTGAREVDTAQGIRTRALRAEAEGRRHGSRATHWSLSRHRGQKGGRSNAAGISREQLHDARDSAQRGGRKPCLSVGRAVLATAIGLSVLVGPAAGRSLAQTAGSAPEAGRTSGTVVLPVEPKTAFGDPDKLSAERRVNERVAQLAAKMAEADVPLLFLPEASREVSLRRAVLDALEANLDIRRSDLDAEAAARAIDEARAVFLPEFVTSLTADITMNRERIETTDRFVQNTVFTPFGSTDSGGNLCITAGGCHRIVFEDNPLITYLQFDTERPEGFDEREVTANERLGPRADYAYTGTLGIEQLLPWGASANLALTVTRDNTIFILNADNPNTESYGFYDRWWTSALSASVSIPVPFTAGFGPNADADVALRQARLAATTADLTTRVVINDTLLAVELRYWDLVRAVAQLDADANVLAAAQRQLGRVERLYGEGLATAGDRANIAAEVARLQAVAQTDFETFLIASELLRRLLDEDEQVIYLPIEYRGLLTQPPDQSPDAEAVLGNPEYLRAEVAVRSAMLERDRAENQARLDLDVVGSVTASQSNALFGYKDGTDSLRNLANPDRLSATAALVLTRPIGNRAARSTERIAGLSLDRSHLSRRQTELEVREAFRSNLASLRIARQRVDIAKLERDRARDTLDRAERLLNAGRIGAYELVSQLASALNAEVTLIQAQVDVQVANARLLASAGRLAERFGERTALTPLERDRLVALRRAVPLHYFGGRT